MSNAFRAGSDAFQAARTARKSRRARVWTLAPGHGPIAGAASRPGDDAAGSVWGLTRDRGDRVTVWRDQAHAGRGDRRRYGRSRGWPDPAAAAEQAAAAPALGGDRRCRGRAARRRVPGGLD